MSLGSSSQSPLFSPVETPFVVLPSLVRAFGLDVLLEFLPLELDHRVVVRAVSVIFGQEVIECVELVILLRGRNFEGIGRCGAGHEGDPEAKDSSTAIRRPKQSVERG